jgi:hypothetical protein
MTNYAISIPDRTAFRVGIVFGAGATFGGMLVVCLTLGIFHLIRALF